MAVSLLYSMMPALNFTAAQPVMHSLASLVVAGSLAAQAVFSLTDLSQVTERQTPEFRKRTVDSFVHTESPIAFSGILCNVGSAGSCVPGASSGIVIAGPGKANPNYFYTWNRDSALAFKCLVDSLVDRYDPSLQTQIENYISAQAYLQTVQNPSGDLASGAGLGEPKFNADKSAFTGSWGRPQRDGPALRATTLITYSKWLMKNGYNATARNNIWPIIQNDLNYVAQYWNQTGFDLWEEVEGSSFFTISAQHRSLVEGSALASLLGTSCPLCDSQAPKIICFLQSFWSSSKGHVLSNINDDSRRSGKDASTILGSIHQFDPAMACYASNFQPCSDVALANHKVVTDSFRTIYQINNGIPEGMAISVGRYPEDSYYAGNPWYLVTLAAAEQLYDALYIWNKHERINVTQISLPFFRDFVPTIQVGSYPSSTSEFNGLVSNISAYADGYMNIVANYTQSNGSLSEQFDKVTGKPLSAYDLTWSYAAFLTAAARREGMMPYSWGVSDNGNILPNAINVPTQCSVQAAKGTYSAAPTPSWPPNQTPPGYTPTSTFSTTSCTPVPTVLVTFNELATTSFGDTIKLAGSVPALGSWDPNQAAALSASDYSDIFPLWKGAVPLSAGTAVKYKYINLRADGTLAWEGGMDHTLSVPTSCETAIAVTDNWQDSY